MQDTQVKIGAGHWLLINPAFKVNWLPITVYLIPEMQLSWERGHNQCFPLFGNVHGKCDQEQRGGHEGHFPDMKGTHERLQAMGTYIILIVNTQKYRDTV